MANLAAHGDSNSNNSAVGQEAGALEALVQLTHSAHEGVRYLLWERKQFSLQFVRRYPWLSSWDVLTSDCDHTFQNLNKWIGGLYIFRLWDCISIIMCFIISSRFMFDCSIIYEDRTFCILLSNYSNASWAGRRLLVHCGTCHLMIVIGKQLLLLVASRHWYVKIYPIYMFWMFPQYSLALALWYCDLHILNMWSHGG